LPATESPAPTDAREPLADQAVAAPATPESLAALHDLIARFWALVERAAPVPPSSDLRARFATAVIEIAGNIIRHAYPPGERGALELRLRAWPDRLEARFSDRGSRYDPPPSAVPATWDETVPEGVPEGGFGLALARSAVDALDYDRDDTGENHWTLVSRLGRGGGEQGDGDAGLL
jgi:anti-sigma regulatory factor (Ser/Thr protein kinase)